MQDIDTATSSQGIDNDMSPYLGSKYHSPITSSSPSPSIIIDQTTTMTDSKCFDVSDNDDNNDDNDDDEISVGCPSPPLHLDASSNFLSVHQEKHEHQTMAYDHETQQMQQQQQQQQTNRTESDCEDYFKPLKKLKMVETDSNRRQLMMRRRRISPPTVDRNNVVDDDRQQQDGVKSFSIIDILNHKPTKPTSQCGGGGGGGRIVRPWTVDQAEVEAHHQRLETLHRQLKLQQQLALLRPNDFVQFATNNNTSYTSETGSDRSSSVASDCCSPDVISTHIIQQQQQKHHQKQKSHHHHHHHHQQQQQQLQTQQQQHGKQHNRNDSTPLDALFQMTSKTFDSSAGESSADGANPLNLFNSRQQPKKKRKSRTAFTNHQIYELEKRFLYQKYLSPADRDEIAQSLGLSNAQVITWFQNRRAKLKRDMEELKKDVESTKLLTAHKSFLENVQDLGILKTKTVVVNNNDDDDDDDDCPKNLVMSEK